MHLKSPATVKRWVIRFSTILDMNGEPPVGCLHTTDLFCLLPEVAGPRYSCQSLLLLKTGTYCDDKRYSCRSDTSTFSMDRNNRLGSLREYFLQKPDSRTGPSEMNLLRKNVLNQEETGSRRSDKERRSSKKEKLPQMFSQARRKLGQW